MKLALTWAGWLLAAPFALAAAVALGAASLACTVVQDLAEGWPR